MASAHSEFLHHYTLVHPVLSAYVLGMTGRPAIAEELLQEIAVELWEKYPAYDRSRPFQPWALGMARIQVLRWRQAQGRQRRMLSMEALEQLTATASAEHGEMHERLRRLGSCLEGVQERGRRLLERHYAHGETAQAIADSEGRSRGAIEITLVRLRRALRACMERAGAEPA